MSMAYRKCLTEHYKCLLSEVKSTLTDETERYAHGSTKSVITARMSEFARTHIHKKRD